MAIMKWGTPPGGDADDRKAHVVGHGDGVALVHAVRGEKVQGGSQQNSLNPNHGPAIKWSTAPYKGPDGEALDESEHPNVWGYRSPKRAKRCMAKGDTCKAWATKASDYEYCYPHWRESQGLKAWSPNEPAARAADDPEPAA